MPPAVAAIGAALLPAIGRIVFGIALNIGFNYISKAFAPKSADTIQGPQGAVIQVQGGGMRGRSHIEGLWATAGSLVYTGSWGDIGTTPNAHLVIVKALSDLPIEQIVGVFVNGKRCTWNDASARLSAGTAGLGYAIPEFVRGSTNHISIRYLDGTQTTACTYLTTRFGTAPHPWTSTRKGKGVAYAIITYIVNTALFGNSPPDVMFEIRGATSYDRRQDSSAGGSGTHRWATPSTWTWTNNAATIAYNIIRGRSWNGVWCYGGQTYSEGQLPLAEWAAAQNVCGTVITNADATTNAQFRAGAEVFWNSQPADEVEEFAKVANMKMVDSGGLLKPHAGAAPVPSFAITDEHIVISDDQTFDPFHPFEHVVNTVEASCVVQTGAWREKPIGRYRDAAHVLADGREKSVEARYLHCFDHRQAQRLSKAIEKESRRERKHAITLGAWAYPYEAVVDALSWTSAVNGYSSKSFVIEAQTLLADGRVRFYIVETDPNEYDWVPGTDELAVLDANFDDVLPDSQVVTGFALTPILITNTGGRARPAIQVNWAPTDVDVVGVDWQLRPAATPTKVTSGFFTDQSLGVDLISAGLTSDTLYEVRIKFRPGSERPVDWTNWVETTTLIAELQSVELADLSIINSKVAPDAIETLNVVDDAITLAAASFTAGGAIYTATLQDKTRWVRCGAFGYTGDGLVTIDFFADAIIETSIANGATKLTFWLVRDWDNTNAIAGTTSDFPAVLPGGQALRGVDISNTGNENQWGTRSFGFSEAPAAGHCVYSFLVGMREVNASNIYWGRIVDPYFHLFARKK